MSLERKLKMRKEDYFVMIPIADYHAGKDIAEGLGYGCIITKKLTKKEVRKLVSKKFTIV